MHEAEGGLEAAPLPLAHDSVVGGAPRAVLRRAVAGRVQSSGSSAIAGAEVTWTAWDSEFLTFVTSAVLIPPALVDRRTVSASADENGAFSFEAPPPLEEGQPSFIWISHSGYFSEVVELDPGVSELHEPLEVTLNEALPFTAAVTKAGEAVAKARVVQRAAYPRGTTAQYARGRYAPKARLVFLRTYQSRVDGTVSLAPCDHPHALRASWEGLVSAEWEGSHRPRVELDLLPTFSLSGHVALPEGADPEWGGARVRVSGSWGTIEVELASALVQPDGAFGPVAVPAMEVDGFTARLEGNEFIETESRFDPPTPGTSVYVQIEARIGYQQWFLALDEGRQPVPFPTAVAKWKHEGVLFEKSVRGREDGYVMVPGFPAGMIWGSLTAKDRVVEPFGPMLLPEDPPAVLNVVLADAYSVSGRCMRGLDPVSDFEVRFWGVDNPDYRGSEVIRNSADGAFTLNHLAGPRVSVMAVTPDFGRSDSVIVDLQEGAEREVLLQVMSPCAIIGQVVDAATSEPIAGARVDVFSSRFWTELDPLGRPTLSDADGRIEIAKLAKGINLTSIVAEGYSDRELKVYVREEAIVNLGQVELVRCQPLTATLRLPEGHDPETWGLFADGIGGVPLTPFDSRGELRFEKASEGAWYFEVRDLRGLGEVAATQYRSLKAGEEWHLNFDLVSGRGMMIDVTGAGDVSAIEGHLVSVSYESDGGRRCNRSALLDSGGRARISGGIAPGLVLLSLSPRSAGGQYWGRALHEITSSDPDEVVLELPLERSESRVLVLDSDKQPISRALVVLRYSRDPELQVAYAITNDRGEAGLGVVPAEVDLAELTSSDGGVHSDIEIAASDWRDGTLELIFDMSASIELLLVDDGQPQSTVTCWLETVDSGVLLTSGLTPDQDGRLSFDGFAEGRYRLRISGPNHWPVELILIARADPSVRRIEVRRVGSLNLEFVHGDGGQVVNLPIDLECTTLGERAANWIASGKLQGFAGGLRTDGQGQLHLPRLPHGEYRWTVGVSSGTLLVPAGGAVTRRVVLVE